MRAFLLVDLGFGDAGKGLLTDFLVRRSGATVVVRYNGGAQAGHNVVTPDGRHHTFAQLGSGSFVAGVRTFLSRHVVVHPTALLAEAAALRAKGVGDALDRVRLSERALVITPFHQAAGRLRELARGAARHGSCGVGVG
ncbi:MAG TPA: adenylosuccinate synthetase, partial [Thermoanaerobaculia bacterium]